MHINVSGLLRNFAQVRRAALSGETVVISTRDGDLALMAQPTGGDSPDGTAPDTTDRIRGTVPPAGASRFVSRTVIADAARGAPRIDAERFRADLDAIVDPHVDG